MKGPLPVRSACRGPGRATGERPDRHQVLRHPAARSSVHLRREVFRRAGRRRSPRHGQGRDLCTTRSSATRSPTCRACATARSASRRSRPRTSTRSCRRWTCSRCRSSSRTRSTSGGSWRSRKPRRFVKPLEEKGLKKIGYIDSGSRNFFTQKPVRTPADLKGQKIRVMASPVMVKTMEALGATGVPVAWAELYTALQTGVVDGAENNHPSVVTKKFYEVSKYYTLDEHMRIPDLIVMSMKLWNQLNADQQKAAVLRGRRAAPRPTCAARGRSPRTRTSQELKGKFTQIIESGQAAVHGRGVRAWSPPKPSASTSRRRSTSSSTTQKKF